MSATEVASTAVHDKLVGVTTCCICDETYREPKILPCVHTFCLACLQRTGAQTKKRPGDQMPCPLCRQEFMVPREGFAGLQKNFFMEGLKEIAAIQQGASGVCEKHKNENLCLFCSDCKEVLCLVCLRESHQNHRLSDLSRAASFLRFQLESDAKRYMSDALKKMERLAQKKVAFLDKTESVAGEILQVMNNLHAIINQHADSLLRNLCLLKKKGITDLETVKKELNEHLAAIKNLEKCCAELASSDGHDSLICNRAIELREQAVKLELFSKSTPESQLRSLEVKFTKTVTAPFEAFDKKDIANLIGKVEAVQSLPRHYYFSPGPVLAVAIGTGNATETEGDGVSGMTVTNNKVFIVNCNNPVIRIYDSNTLRYVSSLNVADYVDYADFGPCASVDETVYIVNRISSEILQIDENLIVSKWSTRNDWRSLSVSDASTIVATCYETSAIREYTPEGILLHEIELGSCHPSQAMKLSNGHFVVSQNGYNDNSNRLCLVNPDGVITKSFDDLRGFGIKHFLSVATGFAVDDDGNVLVLDGCNSRVLLLSPELEFRKELLTKANGLRWPVAMHLDKKTGRLYIADEKMEHFLFCDSKLLVFNVKYALSSL